MFTSSSTYSTRISYSCRAPDEDSDVERERAGVAGNPMRSGGRQLVILSPSSTQSTQLDETEIHGAPANQAPLLVHRLLADEEDEEAEYEGRPVGREDGPLDREPAASKSRGGGLLHRISAIFSGRRSRASAAARDRERGKQRARSEYFERDSNSPPLMQTQGLDSGRHYHSLALAQPLIVDPQYNDNNSNNNNNNTHVCVYLLFL